MIRLSAHLFAFSFIILSFSTGYSQVEFNFKSVPDFVAGYQTPDGEYFFTSYGGYCCPAYHQTFTNVCISDKFGDSISKSYLNPGSGPWPNFEGTKSNDQGNYFTIIGTNGPGVYAAMGISAFDDKGNLKWTKTRYADVAAGFVANNDNSITILLQHYKSGLSVVQGLLTLNENGDSVNFKTLFHTQNNSLQDSANQFSSLICLTNGNLVTRSWHLNKLRLLFLSSTGDSLNFDSDSINFNSLFTCQKSGFFSFIDGLNYYNDTGKILWSAPCPIPMTIASIISDENSIYVAGTIQDKHYVNNDTFSWRPALWKLRYDGSTSYIKIFDSPDGFSRQFHHVSFTNDHHLLLSGTRFSTNIRYFQWFNKWGWAVIADTLGTPAQNLVDESGFQFHPNPSRGEISFEGTIVSSWKLFDLSGRLINEENFSDSENHGTIRLGDLSSGLFILQIQFQNGEIRNEKIVSLGH